MFHMLDMRPGQPTYMEQLARAFEALRKALTRLQRDYEASQLTLRQPTFIPYPLQDVRLASCSNSTAGNQCIQQLCACNTCLPGLLLPVWQVEQLG